MATATDFIGMIYDTIAKTLNINSNTPNIVMQMAWPGFSLSPADFKPANAPNGPYNPDIAVDQFSSIVDMVPALSKIQYENSGYEVSDLYEILLSSAIPIGANQNDITANPVYKLFSNALYDFATMKRGKVDDPNIFYNPAVATPINWYDEAASKSWPTIEINSNTPQPAPQPGTSVFTKYGGAALLNNAIFRLKPKTDAPIKVIPVLPANVKVRTMAGTTRSLNPALIKTATTFNSPHTVSPTGRMSLTMATPVQKETFVKTLSDTRATTIFKQPISPVNKISDPALKADLANITLNKSLNIQATKKLTLGQDILVKHLVFKQLDTKTAQGNTTGFHIKFKYCSVNIDRPWLNLALLSMKNWYMAGVTASDYSTGSLDNNPGMFPLLPISFIVIRDLTISANWSQEDKASLDNSVSFGPFDIRNGSWNQNTLTISGMQIICWVSKVLPTLPPASQP